MSFSALTHRQESKKHVKMDTHTLLKARYDFHMAVLKNYVKYAQEVQNKTKSEVTGEVEKVADQLISQYKFGANFMLEIGRFIQQRYVQSGSLIYDNIVKDSGLDSEVFDQFMSELTSKGELSKVAAAYSDRFRTVLEYRQ